MLLYPYIYIAPLRVHANQMLFAEKRQNGLSSGRRNHERIWVGVQGSTPEMKQIRGLRVYPYSLVNPYPYRSCQGIF